MAQYRVLNAFVNFRSTREDSNLAQSISRDGFSLIGFGNSMVVLPGIVSMCAGLDGPMVNTCLRA